MRIHMIQRHKNVNNNINAKYIKEEEKRKELRETKGIMIVGFVMALACMVMSLVNFYKQSNMLFSTLLGMVSFLFAGLYTWRTKRKNLSIIVMGLAVSIIFSWYAIVGGNEGFAILWILLVPSVSMLAFGFQEGFILSLYFACFLFALFYTPLKQYTLYDYGSVFMMRFPLLYCVDFIGAWAGFRLVRKFQLENQQYKLKLLSYNDELKKEVKKQTVKVENFSKQLIEALAKTIDAKDKYTNGHSVRVAKYAKMIADKMGKDEDEQKTIFDIGMLHDIGKIGVQEEIINKTSKLTDAEYDIIKTHPIIGADILNTISEMPEIAIGARWHHERYDGKGYPDKLKGDNIPEIARIIAVADAYDAMASNRSYRKALPQEVVREEIEKGKGTQFDPQIADFMLELMDEDKDYQMREL